MSCKHVFISRQQSIKIKELHDKPAYQITNKESHDLRSVDGGPPDILINSPPPIIGTTNLTTFYDNKTAKDHGIFSCFIF